MTRTASSSAIAVTCFVVLAAVAQADYKDDIRFTRLHNELGASTPDGSGVVVATVGTGYADPTAGGGLEFPGLGLAFPIRDAPYNDIFSEHDTILLSFFVGDVTSIAPGVPTVLQYGEGIDSEGWTFALNPSTGLGDANSILNLPPRSTAISGGLLPGYSAARVTVSATPPAGSSALLRRLDWYIATDDAIWVGPKNFGPGGWDDAVVMAYNDIIVGLSSGTHLYGYAMCTCWTSPEESIYLLGQHPWPTVIATNNTHGTYDISPSGLSNTTPVGAAAAALLVQAGHDNAALSTDPVVQSYNNRAGLLIRNAERSEVIKAAIMAGADRTARHTGDDDTQKYLLQEASGASNNFGYRQLISDQTNNGLDKRAGAGQLDVRNSYYIVAAGEQNSIEDGGNQNGVPGSGAATRGWDYDPSFGGLGGSNTTATYVLPAMTKPQLLTATLAWNITVVGDTAENPGIFDGTTTLNNLDLALLDVTNIASPLLIASSSSLIENTENLYVVLQANHTYELSVTRGAGSPGFDWDYGIAWQMLDDSDADGAPDENDNCINVANGPLNLGSAGAFPQYDSNGDGYGNICDADINNSGTVTVIDYALLRNQLGQIYPDADLNNSGRVTVADYTILRNMLGKPPGPSAYWP